MQTNPGDILRLARGKRKLTQQEVADEIGITLRQYNKYESGAFPKYRSENVKTIDAFLGTKLHVLLYEQKEEQEVPNEFQLNPDQFREWVKEIKHLKATVYVIKVTVAQLAATSAGKAIGAMLVEMDRAIDEKANSLFDEDKKNQAGV